MWHVLFCLKKMQKHSVRWRVLCLLTCVTSCFLHVKVCLGEKSTWNLESHIFLCQVLVLVWPVTLYCYWWGCKPNCLFHQYWNTEGKYYCLGELLKHSWTIAHFRSLHNCHENANESLPCRFVLSKKTSLHFSYYFQP